MTVSLGRGPAIKLSVEVGAGLSKNGLLRTGQRGLLFGLDLHAGDVEDLGAYVEG